MSNNAAKWSVAVFAHNVEGTIRACIDCVLKASSDQHLSLHVLANGCSDSTQQIVQEIERSNDSVHLVTITMADKANAWNHYVNEIAPTGALHFFIDGDVEVQQDALLHISLMMARDDSINVVGGAPLVGRDRDAWTKRMITLGRVSGGLYAMNDEFLHELRQENIKMPVGFIGEDFLVSALAKNMLSEQSLFQPSPLLQINTKAGFSFHQISPLKVSHYLSYVRRLIRYRIRDYQLNMLFNYLNNRDDFRMPETIRELYQSAQELPGYYWRGRQTLTDWIAVFKIRRTAKKHVPDNA